MNEKENENDYFTQTTLQSLFKREAIETTEKEERRQ
jgi:hypothetical protein